MNLYDVLAEQGATHFERLFSQKFAGGTVQTLTGIPPLSFKANGKPLISLSMLGNARQTGTPSPQSIIMPTFCGVRTGNLFASVWEQGSVNATTGQNEVAGTLVRTKDYIPIKPNTAYSFSRNISNGYMNIRLYRADKSYIGSGSASTIRLISGTSVGNPMGNNTSFCCFEVIDIEASYIRFNDASNNTATKWHMVEGEYTQQTMPEYEPYGWAEKITCAGQTVPVYLGQVPTTRRVRKLVLDGTESWYRNDVVSRENTSYFYTTKIANNAGNVGGYCTHFVYDSGSYGHDYEGFSVLSGYGALRIRISNSIASTVTDLKAWLADQYAAGTPVTVWYVLSTPTTGIINEPLCKIGDYADELHSEDAGVSIPTAKGQNTLTVESELQPSEMTITFKS